MKKNQPKPSNKQVSTKSDLKNLPAFEIWRNLDPTQGFEEWRSLLPKFDVLELCNKFENNA
jgi:hypothetical protein